jgi:NAD(P)H dehydrogenase (quinone)
LRVAQAHQQGEFDTVTDVVQPIGGAPPKSLEAFIRDNATVFGLPQEAQPAAKIPSRPGDTARRETLQ